MTFRSALACLALFASPGLAASARAADDTAFGSSAFDRPLGRPYAYEFTFGHLGWKTSGPFTGWTKNFRQNPIPYRIDLAAVSASRPVASPRPLFRNLEVVHSLVWSSISDGPEHHWGGVATGFRYHFGLPARLRTSLYASFQGGVGAIDASGLPNAQEKDLTFTYLAAAGVRTRLTESVAVHLQLLGQHISNGWQTRPSEGIDASGFSLAVGYRPAAR